MKAKYFRFLIIFLVILIPIFIFGIINTMVGQSYEFQNPNECISIVTGIDLCKAIKEKYGDEWVDQIKLDMYLNDLKCFVCDEERKKIK